MQLQMMIREYKATFTEQQSVDVWSANWSPSFSGMLMPYRKGFSLKEKKPRSTVTLIASLS
ncbi:hypothetical protein ACJX0J_029780, partial [Zea mays]